MNAQTKTSSTAPRAACALAMHRAHRQRRRGAILIVAILITVTLADVYIRLVATGVIIDPAIRF